MNPVRWLFVGGSVITMLTNFERMSCPMRPLRIVVLTLFVLVFSMSACECRKENPSPAAKELATPDLGSKLGSPVAKKSSTPKPTKEAKPTETPPANLPANFPKEIPVIEGSTLMKTSPMANDAQNVIFSVADSVSNVSDTYRNKLQAQGFEITQKIEREGHTFFTFKKGDLLVNVTIADDQRSPGQQIIAVMYETEKPLPFDEF